MADDMATMIDDLPLPPQFQQMQQQVPMVLEQPKRVSFDESNIRQIQNELSDENDEDTNIQMDFKRKNMDWFNGDQNESFYSKLDNKQLMSSATLVLLYVLLGQPYVSYKLINLLGSRFQYNTTFHLVIKGLLLATVYYLVTQFVLPKLT